MSKMLAPVEGGSSDTPKAAPRACASATMRDVCASHAARRGGDRPFGVNRRRFARLPAPLGRREPGELGLPVEAFVSFQARKMGRFAEFLLRLKKATLV